MSQQNLYTLSLDSIKYVLGLISATVDLPNTILDDLNIQTTTTYSSYRLDTLLKALKDENIKYCDEAIAGLNKLSKEIVDDSSKVVKENTIYLILTNPVNNVYEQWLLINGTPQMIGTTEMNLDSVYTKDEADNRFALITNFNSLKTKVDGKVDKTDIVDNLTSIDTDKPLSANQGKVLKTEVDLKANDSDVVKKTDIVTAINNLSTDTQVPSAKAIYNKSKNKIKKLNSGEGIIAYADTINDEIVTETVEILNIKDSPYGVKNASNDFYYTIYNINNYNFKRIVAYDIRKNDMYMIMKKNGVWGTWQRVCTTSVADVPVTNIAPANETKFVGFKGNQNCNYCVKNGVCYVSLFNIKITSAGKTTTGVILPKCLNGMVGTFLTGNGDVTPHVYVHVIPATGELAFDVKDANVNVFGSFSYPVAE